MAVVDVNFERNLKNIQLSVDHSLKRNTSEPLIKAIANIWSIKLSDASKTCIETAVRDYIRKQIHGGIIDLQIITSLTKICIETASELSLALLPVLMLSDAFDMLTLRLCEDLFTCVESNVAIFKEEPFFSQCKNSVLRMCNDLLRRLSRSQNTVFCGRILLFLAQFFPFSERSGLNLISEFNSENITSFAADETIVPNDNSEMAESMTTATLYCKFWSLQDFFRHPVQCFQSESWKTFTSYADDILEAFTSSKLDGLQKICLVASQNVPVMPNFDMDETSGVAVEEFFAKYLTSPKLLDLQFADSNFRRYILFQMLILFQYLSSNIKFKQETLTETQLTWVKKTEDRVDALMAETPPDGPNFVRLARHILKREEKWSTWKNDGCPDFKKPVKQTNQVAVANVKEEETDDARMPKKQKLKRKLGDMICEADAKKRFLMSSNEMTRLWNVCPNNSDACKMNSRAFVPTLESYFGAAIEQSKLDNKEKAAIDPKNVLVNDGNFGWRALRLLACRSPHFFTHSQTPIATLPEYLTAMVKKLAKDLPSNSSNEKEEEAEKEEIITEPTEGIKEDEQMEEQEDETNDRPELMPITSDQGRALAKNLAAQGSGKWKELATKLGFKDDEVAFFEAEKSSAEECGAHMLLLWVENEGDEANKEALLYILEGLEMSDMASGVF